MNIMAKLGGRPNKNDTRSLAYWVGVLEMKATADADPYFLAAFLAAMQGHDPELYTAIHDSALKLRERHVQRINQSRNVIPEVTQ